MKNLKKKMWNLPGDRVSIESGRYWFAFGLEIASSRPTVDWQQPALPALPTRAVWEFRWDDRRQSSSDSPANTHTHTHITSRLRHHKAAINFQRTRSLRRVTASRSDGAAGVVVVEMALSSSEWLTTKAVRGGSLQPQPTTIKNQ